MKSTHEAVNWKLVLIPVAALSVAFAAGTKFFFGDDRAAGPEDPGAVAFSEAEPPSPGDLPQAAGPARTARQGSSLDMFLEVNKGALTESGERRSAGRARLLKAPAAAAASPLDGAVEAYRNYARGEIAAEEAAATPAAPPLPSGPAPWMKGPGTGGKADPALSLKTAASSGAPEKKRTLSSDRNFGKAAFSSDGASRAGASGRGAAAASSFSSGSGAAAGGRGSSRSAAAAGGSAGQADGGLAAGARSGASGGSSAFDSGDPMGSNPLAFQDQKEKPFPFLAIWPNQIRFGSVSRYETAYRTVGVMNTGGAGLRIRRVVNLDTDAPFRVSDNKCDGKSLAPGASCTFRVKFSPSGIKDYTSAFEVETDDEEINSYYNGYIEVKGSSSYSYWAYLLNYYRLGGLVGKGSFGELGAGLSNSQDIYAINEGDSEWRDIKLDTSQLPAAFSVTSENCSGRTFSGWGYCRLTVRFAPTDANAGALNPRYGKYNTVDMYTKRTGLGRHPVYPEVVDSFNFSDIKGTIKIMGKAGLYTREYKVMSSVKVDGQACSAFPVKGIYRSGRYWFFRN
ncbi:MAG TPA: choice-of-anchor D domain-containing protein [Elusimicrobiales bacterium]|nr:choice-of-anchor D domain-containing protein [Elusimicrobiales bacterium]